MPTDGSASARQAVAHAVDFARLVGAEVTGLFVVDNAAFATVPGDYQWDTLHEALTREGQEALAHVERTAGEAGITVATRLKEGHPPTTIVDVAKDGFDLIVMGTLGRTGLSHLLLGSVTERVIRHAPCPVLVIRAKP